MEGHSSDAKKIMCEKNLKEELMELNDKFWRKKKSGTQNAFSHNCASSNWPHCGKIRIFCNKMNFFQKKHRKEKHDKSL
mgnify:CR=1 FL=1